MSDMKKFKYTFSNHYIFYNYLYINIFNIIKRSFKQLYGKSNGYRPRSYGCCSFMFGEDKIIKEINYLYYRIKAND